MASLYRITYLSPNYDQHIKQELEWLAPTDWSPDRVRKRSTIVTPELPSWCSSRSPNNRDFIVSSLAHLTAHEHSALGQKLRLQLHRKQQEQAAKHRRVVELCTLAFTIIALCMVAVVMERDRQLVQMEETQHVR